MYILRITKLNITKGIKGNHKKISDITITMVITNTTKEIGINIIPITDIKIANFKTDYNKRNALSVSFFFTIFKKSSIAKNTKNGIKTCSSLILAR